MVHHYLENEKDDGPTAEETIKFNATIEPAHQECVEAPAPDTPPCCPKMPEVPPIPLPFVAPPSSDLLEALPIIMVSIGVAYVIGVASGAFIFSVGD